MFGLLDHFCLPVVPCYATEDASQIVNLFIYNLHPRNYNHSQLFLTLLRVYTIMILTRQYFILSQSP
jgi:hypothetical protein